MHAAIFLFGLGLHLALGGRGLSAQESGLPPVDFARQVMPLFQEYCWGCHGAAKQESNFRLDVREIAMAAADFGQPPLVAGKPDESPLLEMVAGTGDLVMPPESTGRSLSAAQVEILRRWVEQGAPWPDELAGSSQTRPQTDHWAFQPRRPQDPPEVSPPPQFPLRSGIDHFVLEGLQRAGLEPSPPADAVTLARRIYLDMHGLQPSPAVLENLEQDPSPAAIDALVESVLASPHYGQRWARHWLDVVRFGESTGYEVNRDRANAWYYRDYVIDALNEDRSYRDFIIEQLAGDAVGVDEATGFLVGGPNDIVKSPDINLTLMQREDELADYVNTTSAAFLGLTVGCARCHNHKFDPILQRDYYSMQAIFAGVQHGERPLRSRIDPAQTQRQRELEQQLATAEKELEQLRQQAPAASYEGLWPAVNARLNQDRFDPVTARFVRFTIEQTNQAEPCLDELEVFSSGEPRNVALASTGAIATSSGDYAGNPKHKLSHINDGIFGNPNSWISNTPGTGWVQIELAEPVEIVQVDWARDRQGNFADRLATVYEISVSLDGEGWQVVSSSARRQPFLNGGKEPEGAFIDRLAAELQPPARARLEEVQSLRAEMETLRKAVPVGYVGTFRNPEPTYRLYRGDPLSKREQVPPDTLSVMGSLELEFDTPEQERRLALARWIASDDNPLTARVIVNRVWHYHFGQGLVPTPSDFGGNGLPPSHPELLDWLAEEFVRHDWSLKWLHREILRSSTYRQSSRPRTEALAVDAGNQWLWRFSPRRLSAEAIRDCVLQLSGKLNPQAGGPGFLLFKIDRENVHHYFPLEEFSAEHFRRMIYMTKIRQERDEVFGAFDCPDGGQAIPNRPRSTTPLQALNLLNSKFMIDQAQYLSERLGEEAGTEPADQVRLAYQLAFARQPTEEELADAVNLVQEHGLAAFCRALLNASEFLFLS